ncbi:hypothetical protein LY622_19675 [Halomonas sp. M5N1S17]|uniref:hypothetical protein n=1 Tax=Halomonas alkalisoli TaxID=2907158 RepID=UPI001F466650|nr:hypothetical protein [Halomonas alkalisoli]MCE9665646.1 hypothetical protein [Halomonas alkalisoli]
MNRESVHRMLIAVEMLLLALPTSVVCLFSSVALFVTLGFPWSLMDLAVMHFVLIGTLGILGLWRVAVAYLWNRATWLDHESALFWWWRAACLGAGLAGVSLVLFSLLALGWDSPEWVIIIALGVFGSPLLVPFLHLVYLQRTAR